MRTTVDLPDDLHAVLSSLARDRRTSLSRTVVDLLRQRVGGGEGEARYEGVDASGLPLVRLPGVVTSEDVRTLEDEG